MIEPDRITMAPEFLGFVPDTELRQRVQSFCNLAAALQPIEGKLRTVPEVTIDALHRFCRYIDDRHRERTNPYNDRCLSDINLHFFRTKTPGEADRCFCKAVTAADFQRLAADTTDIKFRLSELCTIDGHPLRSGIGTCYCGERSL